MKAHKKKAEKKDRKKRHKKKTQKRIRMLLAAVLLLIAGVCLFFLFRYIITVRNAGKAMQGILEKYIEIPDPDQYPTPPSPQDEIVTDEYSIPERDIDFAALQKEVNPDIYSWILIPDTPIDYPVVQHPEDNEYYMDYNLDGSHGYPGCIYTENYNSKDWEDVNTILYGHNMRNGTMFAKVNSYKDKDFFEEHRYVFIYSPDAVRVYRVFAAYEFSDLHLMAVCDWNDPAVVSRFFSMIHNYSGIFDDTVELCDDDRYLTMSTCRSYRQSKRLLVHAVLVEEVSD